MRGLQRDEFLASFGPPGTQHGTPEEEEGDDCLITPMEKDARQEKGEEKAIRLSRCSLFLDGGEAHSNGGTQRDEG